MGIYVCVHFRRMTAMHGNIKHIRVKSVCGSELASTHCQESNDLMQQNGALQCVCNGLFVYGAAKNIFKIEFIHCCWSMNKRIPHFQKKKNISIILLRHAMWQSRPFHSIIVDFHSPFGSPTHTKPGRQFSPKFNFIQQIIKYFILPIFT